MKYDEGSLSGFRQNNTLSMQKHGGWRQRGREREDRSATWREMEWDFPEMILNSARTSNNLSTFFLPSPLFLKSLPFPSRFLFPCLSHSLLLPNPLTNPHYTQTPLFATLLSGFAAQITPRFWSFVRIRPWSVRGWKSICKTGCACWETTAGQELYVHAVCFYGLINRLISMY